MENLNINSLDDMAASSASSFEISIVLTVVVVFKSLLEA